MRRAAARRYAQALLDVLTGAAHLTDFGQAKHIAELRAVLMGDSSYY